MLEKRKYLYARRDVGDNRELDYLISEIPKMDIPVERSFTIDASTQFRTDLISKISYDSFNYGWLIMDFNDITDPFEELVQGKVLRIPDLDEYLEFFNTASKVSKQRRN